MAYAVEQTKLSLIAETTFAKTDLYKFVQISTANGRVSIVATTAPTAIVGTLLSQTYSTSTGANETVTVGSIVDGIGKVYMAGSTNHVGSPVACSSLGFGIAPTTNSVRLGYIVEGTSGTTGTIASVLFVRPTLNL